jgi:HPt (histidine-containing phosphotransfer) domain-containing protein
MSPITHRFAELKMRYAASVPAKREVVEAAWLAFSTSPGEETAAELLTAAHRLSGSAPAYGFAAIGTAARTVDSRIHAWAKCAPAEREPAAALATSLAGPVRSLLDSIARAITATTIA